MSWRKLHQIDWTPQTVWTNLKSTNFQARAIILCPTLVVAPNSHIRKLSACSNALTTLLLLTADAQSNSLCLR